MTDATPFPLDFEKLRRGDYLAPEEVERSTLTPRTDPSYRLAVMRICSMIVDHFYTTYGDIVAVVSEHDGIRILTHPEQAEYAPRVEQSALRKMGRSIVLGRGVDLQQLSDDSSKRFVEWQQRASWRHQQLRKPMPPELTG